ncbi:phage holin family protein [Allosphingosinicella flava]|uniref:Phage holin family protein n=1 Tax=Allosphingosinicella flava TaxID=2771430 RepID=A0A7T2GL20_9SPHN|nr:phage holin family protein [Sphingosinicella flava]QPQ55742.1 phage holin family protein [Sphingosinicella flava]
MARINPDDGIGDLVSRLIADGKAMARAEVNLVKAVAQHRAEKAKSGAILLGAGIALLLAGFIGLIVGIVMGLAPLIGPLLAGVAVIAVAGIIGFLLIRAGARKLAVLGSGSEEEREALDDGLREAA